MSFWPAALDRADFGVLLTTVLFWYAFEPFGGNQSDDYSTNADDDAAERHRSALKQLPIGRSTFNYIYLPVYGLVAGANFVYWRDASSNGIGEDEYTATMVLFIVAWLLNKSWTPLFFLRNDAAKEALGVIAAVLVVAGFATVFVWRAFGFVSFVGLSMLVYSVWTLAVVSFNALVVVSRPTKSTYRQVAGDANAQRPVQQPPVTQTQPTLSFSSSSTRRRTPRTIT